MKKETQLTLEEQAEVFNLVEEGIFGKCVQDKYLNQLVNLLKIKNISVAMRMPAIVCDNNEYQFVKNDAYRFVENNRKIIDMLNPDKDIHVYFDHPVHQSALYLGIFNRHMVYPIIKAVEDLKATYQTTPLGQLPITVKIDMNSFVTQDFSRKKVMQSLEYVRDSNSIITPEQLFDVVDKESQSKY